MYIFLTTIAYDALDYCCDSANFRLNRCNSIVKTYKCAIIVENYAIKTIARPDGPNEKGIYRINQWDGPLHLSEYNIIVVVLRAMTG